jgi:hypothetical protein
MRYKRPRPVDSIEGMGDDEHFWRRDRFEGRYLSADHDTAYFEAEDEPPLIPSTLTDLELQVLCLLYESYRQTEIARYLRVEKRDIEKAVRNIRTKMADWSPDVDDRICRLPELADAPELAQAS